MQNNYCIYIHKNKINNKVYIGLTKYGDNPNKRWRNGTHYNESPHFDNAIQKYGWDQFEHLIIEKQLTLQEAIEAEKFYIELYDATNKDKGYNMTKGGEGHLGMPLSAKTKEKISIANSIAIRCLEDNLVFRSATEASKYYNIGRPHISSACNGSRITAGGKHWEKISLDEPIISNDEAYKRIVLLENTRETGGKKQIICLETNKVYNSVSEASESLGISKSCITDACKGNQKTAAGLHWEYYDNSQKYNIQLNEIKINNIEEIRKSPAKQVRCIETQIIYNSAIEAEKATGASRSGISNCCNGKAKTANKLHWEFV